MRGRLNRFLKRLKFGQVQLFISQYLGLCEIVRASISCQAGCSQWEIMELQFLDNLDLFLVCRIRACRSSGEKCRFPNLATSWH